MVPSPHGTDVISEICVRVGSSVCATAQGAEVPNVHKFPNSSSASSLILHMHQTHQKVW